MSAHAYSVIAAVEVNVGCPKPEEGESQSTKSETVKFLRLRNPWGFREWTGKWADHQKEWDKYPDAKENIAKALKQSDEKHFARTGEKSGEDVISMEQDPKDGIFWMTFEDFIDEYDLTAICYYEPKWKNNVIDAVHERLPEKRDSVYRSNLNYFAVEVPKKELLEKPKVA